MRSFILIMLLSFSLVSCVNKEEVKPEIEKIGLELELERFDMYFSEGGAENIDRLMADYPFLFSSNFTKENYLARLNDSLQQQLHKEVRASFESFPEIDDIRLFYKHMIHYFSGFKVPRVISVISDVDYRNKIIVTDSITLIGLDNYLGSEHEFYSGIPQYVSDNLRREMMVPDLAEAYARKMVPAPVQRSFLADMVYHGKLLYFKDVVIPFITDENKIGYSKNELEWARENESNIWRYFVEKELLYDTDPKLAPRFLNPAPFSKFYLELDNESPGRLGQYIGWQIVRSYMDNNDTGFREMMNKDADEIFNNARFKPRR